MNFRSKLLFIAFFISLTALITSCKKDEDPAPQQPAPKTPLELQPNAQVIDTSKMILDLTTSDLNSGTYVFKIIGEKPTFKAGDVMIGREGEGYIRKIISVSDGNGTVTYQTIQGTFEDVFKKGDLNMELDMNDMKPDGRLEGFSYSITNKTLYSNGPLNVDLVSANLSLDPKWNLNFSFEETGIKYFEMATSGTSWQADAKVKVTASQAVKLLKEKDTLVTFQKLIVKWVQVGFVPVPIVVKLKIQWLAEYSVDLAANISTSADVSTNGNLSLGIKYSNEQWQGIYNFNPTSDLVCENLSGNAKMTIKYAWRPVITAKLNGVLGSRASMGLMTDVIGNVASPSLDWDLKADAWLQPTVGADVTILGKKLVNFPDIVWESKKLTYIQPDKIQKISGDNQSATASSVLAKPCRVRIIDNMGAGVKNVPVYFTVKTVGGSVSPSNILTDKDGYAETFWTLGDDKSTAQKMEASSKSGNLSPINASPIIFSATADPSNCPSSVMDADGNVYPVAEIGNQCWTASNLKTSKFADGSAIPNNTDVEFWSQITTPATPAWRIFNNKPINDSIYGKLYNWYAISDPRNVCPNGWHVPTNEEWDALANYLGGDSIAGGKMKTLGTQFWQSPNIGATNESGFSGLPGGRCSGNLGTLSNLGDTGFWWSYSAFDDLGAWFRFIKNNEEKLSKNYYYKASGFSVRCKKN